MIVYVGDGGDGGTSYNARRHASQNTYNIKYTTTPVTETYNQIGRVQRAIRR